MGHWGCYMVNISLVVVPAGWGAAAGRTLGLFTFFFFFFTWILMQFQTQKAKLAFGVRALAF